MIIIASLALASITITLHVRSALQRADADTAHRDAIVRRAFADARADGAPMVGTRSPRASAAYHASRFACTVDRAVRSR